jgi:hypothetical protein
MFSAPGVPNVIARGNGRRFRSLGVAYRDYIAGAAPFRRKPGLAHFREPGWDAIDLSAVAAEVAKHEISVRQNHVGRTTFVFPKKTKVQKLTLKEK